MTDDHPTEPPLLATRDPALAEAVQATALALHVDLQVAADPDEVRASWRRAPLRLVGPDVAARVSGLESCPRTFVVGIGDGPGLLEASALLRAPVLALPAASAELADVLRQELDRGSAGQVVAVVGASGGLGVSTLAVALGARAAASKHHTAVVELAEFGGGLDLLCGAEMSPGLRWDSLLQAGGQLGSLSGHLVVADGVDLLAASRESPRPPGEVAVAAVLESLSRSHEVVVADCGRGVLPAVLDGVQAQVLLVVAADVAGVAAARMLVEERGLASARIVVRGGPGRGLPGAAVAEALGMELAGVVGRDKAVPLLAESGTTVASGRARHFHRDVEKLWKGLVQ